MTGQSPYSINRRVEQLRAPATDNGPMRILVIEDDKRTADYLLKGLTECGYTAD